jgi:uncharacterized protein
MLGPQESEDEALRFKAEVLRRAPHADPASVLQIPRVKHRVCGAQSRWSMCIHPSGTVYKCGLEVHDPALGGDHVERAYRQHENYRKWVNHDPFAREECRKCVYLPLCLGGCPKYSSNGHSGRPRRACFHWSESLRPLLTMYADAVQERSRRASPATAGGRFE